MHDIPIYRSDLIEVIRLKDSPLTRNYFPISFPDTTAWKELVPLSNREQSIPD